MDTNDIREQILSFRWGEDRPSYINYFASDPKKLQELVNCIERLEEYPIKEYGSWMFMQILKSKKVSGLPFYEQLVDILFKTDNQSVLRNIASCMLEIGIQEYRESELFDLLLGFLNDSSNKVALQMYAIRLLIQLCEKYPELVPEVREVIHLNNEGKSPAYKVGVRDFDKKFRK